MAIGCVGITISCIITYWEGITQGAFTQNYVQLFDYVSAIVVFVLVKKIVVCRENRSDQIKSKRFSIYQIGTLTLGIYLFDPFLKEVLYNPYARIVEKHLPLLICSFGWVLISMILGGIITYILKKLPGFRKLL